MDRYELLYVGSGSAQRISGRVEYASFLVRADCATSARMYILNAVQLRWQSKDGWINHTTEQPCSLENMLVSIETQERVAGFVAGSWSGNIAEVEAYIDSRTDKQ